jgi:hypothetical protein
MRFTLDIQNQSVAKILPLIEYLKSLDFVRIEEETDDSFSLTAEQKAILDKRLETRPEDYLAWEDVKKSLRFK